VKDAKGKAIFLANYNGDIRLGTAAGADGRFTALRDVVNHYDAHFGLSLSEQEKVDLIEYLKSH
jgi:hypothetical protein